MILHPGDRGEGQRVRVVRLLVQRGELRRELRVVEQRLLGLERRHHEHEAVSVVVLPVVPHRIGLADPSCSQRGAVVDTVQRRCAEFVGKFPVGLDHGFTGLLGGECGRSKGGANSRAENGTDHAILLWTLSGVTIPHKMRATGHLVPVRVIRTIRHFPIPAIAPRPGHCRGATSSSSTPRSRRYTPA